MFKICVIYMYKLSLGFTHTHTHTHTHTLIKGNFNKTTLSKK